MSSCALGEESLPTVLALKSFFLATGERWRSRSFVAGGAAAAAIPI